MKKSFIFIALLASIFFITGCQSQPPQVENLYQVSTLQSLMQGNYAGAVSIEDLKSKGDSGLGTFDGLAGEMIVIDGDVYQGMVDGNAYKVCDCQTTPFANVAFMHEQEAKNIAFTGGLDSLKAEIDKQYPSNNMTVLFRMDGTFTDLTYRSVPEQSEPYPPLVEVAKHQVVTNKKNITGSIVGFRFPSYMKGINIEGYHLHFISSDRKFGGHLLSVASGEVSVLGQTLNNFEVYLPEHIKDYCPDNDSHADIEKVEKASK